MPVVGQGDDDRIDGLVVECPAKVGVGRDRFTPILEGLDFAVQVRLIHVAEARRFLLPELPARGDELVSSTTNTADGCGSAEPDHGQAHGFVGGQRVSAVGKPRRAEREASDDGFLQEVSACCWLHIFSRRSSGTEIQPSMPSMGSLGTSMDF